MSESKDIEKVFKPMMENDRVRILDFRLDPGKKTAQHSHPDTVVCALNDQKLRFIYPDSKDKELEFKTGTTKWIDAETHIVENIGETEAHGIIIELKK